MYYECFHSLFFVLLLCVCVCAYISFSLHHLSVASKYSFQQGQSHPVNLDFSIIFLETAFLETLFSLSGTEAHQSFWDFSFPSHFAFPLLCFWLGSVAHDSTFSWLVYCRGMGMRALDKSPCSSLT